MKTQSYWTAGLCTKYASSIFERCIKLFICRQKDKISQEFSLIISQKLTDFHSGTTETPFALQYAILLNILGIIVKGGTYSQKNIIQSNINASIPADVEHQNLLFFLFLTTYHTQWFSVNHLTRRHAITSTYDFNTILW